MAFIYVISDYIIYDYAFIYIIRFEVANLLSSLMNN